MEVLITDNDIGFPSEEDTTAYEVRTAARAIVYNKLGEIALLRVRNGCYNKLPGGGVEDGESIDEALIRELHEEVGAKVKIITKIGSIREHRAQFKQTQVSHFYVCSVEGDLSAPVFTEREIADGFNLKWVTLSEAISEIKIDCPQNYVGRFIRQRDLIAVLEENKRTAHNTALPK